MQIQIEQYEHLIGEIGQLIASSKKQIATSINTALVETYWHIGRYIVEYEQGGAKRAGYGTELLKTLSTDLSGEFGKGFSERNLKYMRGFYSSFSTLDDTKRQSLIANLSWTHIVRLLSVRDSSNPSVAHSIS